MIYQYSDIKVLQAEISSDCNAACPQCPRNDHGGATIANLPVTRWRLDQLPTMFTDQFVGQLKMLYLCGTYGDPMMNPEVVEIVDWFKDRNRDMEVGIHTNGGVGRVESYRQLASRVDFIGFGIDGLADTNHIYRRQVRWPAVEQRVQAFVGKGGKAIWDFIVFRHNQHQIDEARQLSEEWGMSSFNIKRTHRFMDRRYSIEKRWPIKNRLGEIEGYLYPPNEDSLRNSAIQQPVDLAEITDTKITCNAGRIKELYVASDGTCLPCGWLHDRFYGPTEPDRDTEQMKEWIQQMGGRDEINCRHRSVESIVEGDWFGKIASGHTKNSKDRLQRCGVMCGSCVNPIGIQNTEVAYKE